MWDFKRHVDEDLIKKLIDQPLWKDKLKNDCNKGEIFLAIRDGSIGFYYKGGRLFEFKGNSLKTHIKYASVIETTDENNYVSQEKLKDKKLICDFIKGYNGIKRNCELYSGEEAKGVSYLYQNSSYLLSDNYIVLDIEVAFKKEKKEQDRIDILLYDNKNKNLRFVEAKHFSNKDLWSNKKPRVIEQIERYEDQIKQNEDSLIKEYGHYIKQINKIFNKKLNIPESMTPEVSLLIFGFDEEQMRGKRFKELIYTKPAYKNITLYCKGDPSSDLMAETIWKKAKKP